MRLKIHLKITFLFIDGFGKEKNSGNFGLEILPSLFVGVILGNKS